MFYDIIVFIATLIVAFGLLMLFRIIELKVAYRDILELYLTYCFVYVWKNPAATELPITVCDFYHWSAVLWDFDIWTKRDLFSDPSKFWYMIDYLAVYYDDYIQEVENDEDARNRIELKVVELVEKQ